MLKTGVRAQPDHWDEHLDFCMMAFSSSVHTLTDHIPFELVFGWEMRIPLDIMMGGAPESECPYSEFVANLQDNLEQAYSNVRENLNLDHRLQKDAFHKGVKHTVCQNGDFVFHYNPHLRFGEASFMNIARSL